MKTPIDLEQFKTNEADVYDYDKLKAKIENEEREYVDLGLPSGTLWADENISSDFYTYNEAIKEFPGQIPTLEQYHEIIDGCVYVWDAKRCGGWFISKVNGNRIFLPALGLEQRGGVVGFYGELGQYLSTHLFISKLDSCTKLHCLSINKSGSIIDLCMRARKEDKIEEVGKFSVRLVK